MSINTKGNQTWPLKSIGESIERKGGKVKNMILERKVVRNEEFIQIKTKKYVIQYESDKRKLLRVLGGKNSARE